MARVATVLACVAAIAVPGSGAGAAPTPIPEHFCSKPIRVQGQLWGVQGSGVRCNFMRFWTYRWLDHRGDPRGWSCLDLGETGECDKRHARPYFEYYAID